MRIQIRQRQVLVAVALLSLASVAGALVSQHVFGLMPCAWCVFQRLLYLVVAAFALLGAFTTGGVRRAGIGIAVVTALAGVASALWQEFHAVNENSCDLSLAEKIIAALHLDALFPNVFMAFASCADAEVKLLGVPYAMWSWAMFTILAIVGLWTLRFDLRHGGRAR